jgi:hypothetical protein
MQAKTADPSELLDEEKDYKKAIDDCLKEMKAMRKEMKRTDAEIRRSQMRSDKLIEETKAILRDVEKRL